MMSDLKTAIVNKLMELYPTGYAIYDEDLPDSISKPAFLIRITKQSYNRQLNNKFISNITIDISYYSSKSAIRSDCIQVQETLLKAFDLLGTYQVTNKIAGITESILHFTFDIRFTEIISKEEYLMQQQKTNTIL